MIDFIKSEFNYNVVETLEDYSRCSKQIGIGKLRRKWISRENTFLEKEKSEMSDWYWSPEETKKFYKKFKHFSKWREYNSKKIKE